MNASPMLKFIKLFGRDLQGRQEHPLFLNMAHIVKIEVAADDAAEVSSVMTLTSGEKLRWRERPKIR
ncbi:MAG: hypothetical protein WCS94_12020 [Verrucomicrobiota bacterium]